MAKKIDEDVKRQVLELHQKGYPNNRIAKQMGLSRNTVANILKEIEKPEDKIDVSSLLKGMDMVKSESEKMEYLLDSITNLYYTDEYFRNKMEEKFFYHMKVKEYQFLNRILKYSKKYNIDLDTIASWVNVISKLKSLDITPSEIIALAENQVTIKMQRDEISKNLKEIENLKSQIAKIQEDIKYSYGVLGGIKNYKDLIRNYNALNQEYMNLTNDYRELDSKFKDLQKEYTDLMSKNKALDIDRQNLEREIDEFTKFKEIIIESIVNAVKEKIKDMEKENSQNKQSLLEYMIGLYFDFDNEIELAAMLSLIQRYGLNYENIDKIRKEFRNLTSEEIIIKLAKEIIMRKIQENKG